MKRVAIVSDSHVPKRASEIPGWVKDEVGRADHTIHAGDFDAQEALETFRGLADGMTCVHGNMDPGLGLPDVDSVVLEEVEFVVTHGDRPSGGFEDYVAGVVREHSDTENAVGVAGHTHEALDTTAEGVRVLNPGTCTAAWPGNEATMMRAEVDGEALEVELLRR